MKFGKLDMEPAENPAVLDTATWNIPAAMEAMRAAGNHWSAVRRAILERTPAPELEGYSLAAGSVARRGSTVFLLVQLPDRQQAFAGIGPGTDERIPGDELGRMPLGGGQLLSVHSTHAAVVDRYCRTLNPVNSPRPLGKTPRLGIGARMTTAVWPGAFDAMDQLGFAANTIQNSVRELNLLDDLLEGRPAPTNYACGFGTIETGYTGSSFEGLWVSGVLAALHHDKPLRYGADADHVQVKRTDEGLASARRTLDAARYYTFYTLDVSDVLDYRALCDQAWAESRLAERVPEAGQRRDLLAWHSQADGAAGGVDTGKTTRFAAKYAAAFDAIAALRDHIVRLKDGRAFDLEISIDEHPPEIPAFDGLTSDEETLFVLREAERRGIAVTHVAPNFGVEKGRDYRHPGGLDGLLRRVESQHRLAEAHGCMLDIHSADDLGPAARETLRRATGGRLHYKISPSLQLLFAETLRDFHQDLFLRWWQGAEEYARREAEAGLPFAAECLAAARPAGALPPPSHPVFHNYSFAFVGRRDGRGRFLHRDEFYSLSPAFYREYRNRVCKRLAQLAREVTGMDGRKHDHCETPLRTPLHREAHGRLRERLAGRVRRQDLAQGLRTETA